MKKRAKLSESSGFPGATNPRLSDFELILVLAVMRLESEAYGAEMAREIQRRTGRDVALGAIYKTLDRLEIKGYLDFEIGAPREERGGRRRKHYRPTALGRRALERTLHDLDAMRQGLRLETAPVASS